MGLGSPGAPVAGAVWAGWGVTLVALHATEVTATAAWRRHSGGVKPGGPGRPAGKETPAMSASIEINALTKRYGATTAVSDLTFTVRPGVVTGFLGPNGAGKTTTMRMILG